MKAHVQRTAKLGDLIVAVFDEAASYTNDPAEVSRLASRVVAHMVQRERHARHPPRRRSAVTA